MQRCICRDSEWNECIRAALEPHRLETSDVCTMYIHMFDSGRCKYATGCAQNYSIKLIINVRRRGISLEDASNLIIQQI